MPIEAHLTGNTPRPTDVVRRMNGGLAKEGKPPAQGHGIAAKGLRAARNLARAVPAEPHWDLAFFGILSYMFVEYTRLNEVYPLFRQVPLAKLLIALAVVGLLVSPRPQGSGHSGPRGTDFALFFFLLACLASILFARDSALGLDGFFLMLRWAFVYFLISRILTNTWRLRVFIFLLLLLNFKLAQFVIRTYFSELSFGRSEAYLSVHGVGAGVTDFFGNSGEFGVAMCVVWPLAGSLLFGEPKKSSRVFLWACFGVYLVSIFLCGSRGAIVGAAAAALVTWAKNPKRIAGVLTVLLLALGSFYILPTGYRQRMLSAFHWQRDATAQMRMDLWSAGFNMWEKNPILGVGLNNFGVNYWADYSGRGLTTAVTAPHSIYMEALSETGVAGSVPLLFLWFLFLRENARTRRHLKTLGLADRRSFEYRLSIGLDLAFVGYMVSGAFVTVLLFPHLWYLLGLSAALHSACLRKQPEIAPVESANQERNLAPAPY